MANKTSRQVRLHSKYRPQTNLCENSKEVPWLNVSGAWLQKAGFKAGDQIEITVGNKQLIIKNLTGDGDQSH